MRRMAGAKRALAEARPGDSSSNSSSASSGSLDLSLLAEGSEGGSEEGLEDGVGRRIRRGITVEEGSDAESEQGSNMTDMERNQGTGQTPGGEE